MKKPAILCVDDDQFILRSLMDQLLHILGDTYRIELAENAEEALEVLEELMNEGIEVPLIISDQLMPGMKGDELLITVHSRYPQALKIFLTGQADAHAVGNAVNNANLYRYIAKPWDQNDFKLTITEALYRYTQDKRLEEQRKLREQALEQERLAKEALRKANEELELRVHERTTELASANAQLQADIAEQKRLEQELRHAKEIADAANKAKSIFLATMSHELRTPLNAILGFAQLLLYDRHLKLKQREYLTIINRSGEHLLTLINQVLDLSKIEAGKMMLNEQEFNLSFLLNGVVELFRLRAQEKGLLLVFECAPDVPRFICSDQVKLRQILINLLSNAVKFTGEGSVTLRVWVKGQRQEGEPFSLSPLALNLEFGIEDTGIGIAPNELERIFEAFTQTAGGQLAQEGTGLGLSICQRFVQLLGGEITVTSEVGRGTIFRFSIRTSVVSASNRQLTFPSPQAVAISPDQSRNRILIVDDQLEARQLLVALLKPMGFELQEAERGEQALAIWKQWHPHLIWMDIRLPDIDGYEVTKTIRKTEEQESKQSGVRTKIIAVTAGGFREERTVSSEAGCDDFLLKPFRSANIFDLLHKHLEVEFTYQQATTATEETRSNDQRLLTPEMLDALPQDIRLSLKHAVETIELKQAKAVIAQIRQYNGPLADSLESLVNNYRFDTLQQLVEKISQNKI
jgi:signal transduction histidine kinase